jgi:hypothetical protein
VYAHRRNVRDVHDALDVRVNSHATVRKALGDGLGGLFQVPTAAVEDPVDRESSAVACATLINQRFDIRVALQDDELVNIDERRPQVHITVPR